MQKYYMEGVLKYRYLDCSPEIQIPLSGVGSQI